MPKYLKLSSQQSSNDFVAPISSGIPDDYDDGLDPTGQLLGEYWTSFAANNQESSVQIPTADNGYTSSDALTYTPITPPQSSKDISLPLKSQQLSVSAVAVQRKDVDSNVYGHKRTRRARTRAADTVERPMEVSQNSSARKTRKKHCS